MAAGLKLRWRATRAKLRPLPDDLPRMSPSKFDSASVPQNRHFTSLFANIPARVPPAVVAFSWRPPRGRTGSDGGRVGGQAAVRARAGADAKRERLSRGPGKGTACVPPAFILPAPPVVLVCVFFIMCTFLIREKNNDSFYRSVYSYETVVCTRTEPHAAKPWF